jgi:hypothetical protein
LCSDRKYPSVTVGKFGPWITSSRKKLFSTEMGFWRRAVRTSRLPEVRNEVIRGKMGVNPTTAGRLEK